MKRVFFFGLRTIAGHSLRSSTKDLPAPVKYFTIVREPLQRCLSHYQHVKRAHQRNGKDIAFDRFLENEDYTDCQVRRIAGEPILEKALEEFAGKYFFVGLTERFAESLVILKNLSPCPLTVAYTRRHVTKDTSVKEEVLNNAAHRDLLEERNQLDLALYAYVRDVLYPSFRKRAGVVAQEFDERSLHPSSYPVRYKLTRWYNQAVYRNLSKLRRVAARM